MPSQIFLVENFPGKLEPVRTAHGYGEWYGLNCASIARNIDLSPIAVEDGRLKSFKTKWRRYSLAAMPLAFRKVQPKSIDEMGFPAATSADIGSVPAQAGLNHGAHALCACFLCFSAQAGMAHHMALPYPRVREFPHWRYGTLARPGICRRMVWLNFPSAHEFAPQPLLAGKLPTRFNRGIPVLAVAHYRHARLYTALAEATLES